MFRQGNLQSIPGVGPAMERDLKAVGMRSISCLKGQNPERLYQKLIKIRGRHQDRCVLYIFRCAVYYANTKHPKPSLLKWWNWQDKKLLKK